MVNDFNQKTALRTRRMPFRPSPENDAEHSANVLPVGTHLGEFEILDLIGEGGFGIVYLAYDHSLERQVALKEYMPSGLAKRTTRLAVTVRSQHNLETFTAGLKSFINEARMLAQFDSQSLVKVHRFWEGNGTAYMVMPFYEGITLKQALKQRRVTPSESWIRVLLGDLFDAIEIIHRGQCLHRDIAPDNILLLKDGRPLLLDFGAARRVIGDLTQCLTAILKPGYAPIEQYADIAGLRQGPWTDIYALAAVVYYLVAGKAPPPAVARMVHDELVPAREVGKGRYSPGFLAAIDKALSVKPEQRFRSIAELRHALDIMEAAPRTIPRSDPGFTTTMVRTDTEDPLRTQMPIDMMPDVKTRIAPPLTQRSERQRSQLHSQPRSQPGPQQRSQPQRSQPRPEPQSQLHAQSWAQPQSQPFGTAPAGRSGYGKREWIVLGLLLTAGVASGIYLGSGSSWNILPGDPGSGAGTATRMESSGASEVPGQEEDTSLAESPYTTTPPPSTSVPQTAESTSRPALPSPVPPMAKASPSAEPPASEASAQQARRELSTPQALPPSREDELWRQASSADKPGAYEKYLKEYPKGRYAPLARLRLESKQPKKAAPSPEEELWTAASAVNTETAYSTYLRKYPKGRYAPLAKDRIASFNEPYKAAGPEKPAPVQPPMASRTEAPAPSPAPAMTTATAAAPAPAPTPAPMSAPATALASAPAPEKTISTAPPVPATPPATAIELTPPERKPVEATDKLASIKPPEKAATLPPRPAAESGSVSVPAPETSTSPGRKPLVLADQTMIGNFAVDPKTGAVSGTGKIIWTNGNQFEGTLVKGMKEGKGKFIWSNGQRYSGDWARDMPNGRGIITFADGSRYEGDVKDGMPHGRGATRFKSGDVYVGSWVHGKSHGQGRYTWANGSYWEGEFRDDKRTDNGTMVFAEAASGGSAKAGEPAPRAAKD